MFRKDTVFILGAGASWHYGYPTGEELIKEVIAKTGIAEDYFRRAEQSGIHWVPTYIERNGKKTRLMGGGGS
jgi:hypothetical protein